MPETIDVFLRRSSGVIRRHFREIGSDLLDVARGNNAQSRSYESGSAGRRLARMNAPATDGNAEVFGDGNRTRNRSRTMERDSAYAQKALRAFAVEQVGDGIRPRFVTGSDKTERILRRDWDDFSFQADGLTGGTVYGLQLASVMGLVRDGGTLLRRRWRRVDDVDLLGRKLAVPLQLQPLEIDHLATIMDGPTNSGGLIANGIELDPLGRRVAYHLYRQHPGSGLIFGGPGSPYDVSRVSTQDLTHVFLYNFARPGQMVDVPWLHAAIARLWDLDGWQDATMLARRMSASMAAFVEGGDPLAPPDTVDGINPRQGSWATSGHLLDGRGFPIEQFEPGMVGYLPNGKVIHFPDQPQVPGHEETTRVMLREVAAAAGDSYESLSGDLRGSNYISLRMGLLPRMYLMRAIRNQVTIPLLCRPMGLWFLDAEIMARRIAGNLDVSVEWIPPAREDADELTRQKILEYKIRNGLQTWSETLISEGVDPENHAAAAEKCNALIDKHGLILDIDPRNQTAAGQPTNRAVKAPAKTADTSADKSA